MDREDEVSKMFIISLLCVWSPGSEWFAKISIHEERLQISEAGRKQNESISFLGRLIARFSTQFRVKESFKTKSDRRWSNSRF